MAVQKTNQFTLIWKIKNCLTCYINEEKISSPSFVVDFLVANKWHLDFYPSRNYDENEDKYTECYLSRAKPDTVSEAVFLGYKVELLDFNRHVLNIFESKNREFKTNSSWGWVNMLKSKELYENMKTWTEDTLTIRCTITSGKVADKPQITECEALTILSVDSRWFKLDLENFGSLCTAETVALPSLDNTPDLKVTMSAPHKDMIINIQVLKEELLEKLIMIRITFSSNISKKIASKCDVHIFHSMKQWQYPTFVNKEILKLPNILPNHHKCSVICQYVISKGCILSSSIERYIHNFSSRNISMPGLKSHSSLHKDFKKLYMNKKFSDVILRAGSIELPAHKNVLAVRSPVFSAMFDQEMVETQTGIVNIEDTDESTLQYLIEFIYTENMNEMEYECALKLLLAAEKYQVQTLVEECSSLILCHLSVENVCEVIAVGDMINHENLKNVSLSYICDNAVEVLSTPNWSELIKNNVKLASDILKKLSEFIKKEKI